MKYSDYQLLIAVLPAHEDSRAIGYSCVVWCIVYTVLRCRAKSNCVAPFTWCQSHVN
jgi:hypothetical protein